MVWKNCWSSSLIVPVMLIVLMVSGCLPNNQSDAPSHPAAALLMAPMPIPMRNQRPPLAVNTPLSTQPVTTPSPADLTPMTTEPAREQTNENAVLETAIAQNQPPTVIGVESGTPMTRSPSLSASRAISTVIGYSTGSRPIVAYHFGNGPHRVALVGGIHGGSEWNSVLLAYRAIDYFTKYPSAIPSALTVQIIPAANPDGLYTVTGKEGRFTAADVQAPTGIGRVNQNGVDLNRNWDCDWAATAWWGSSEISGGTAPFSEVETQALRNFFIKQPPIRAAIFWHSAAPGVFAGGCTGTYVAAEHLAEIYANEAKYPYGDGFTSYPITGDATNWLSLQHIPAIVVELATRDQTEWTQNLAGMQAVLTYLAGDLSRKTPFPTPTVHLSP